MSTLAAPLLDRLDTTVCVLTTAHEGAPAGCIEPVAASLRDSAAVPLRAAEVYASGLDKPRAPALFPWRA